MQHPEPGPGEDLEDVVGEDAVGEDAVDEGSPGEGRTEQESPDRSSLG